MNKYSKKEIKKHNNIKDCWVISHNYVYNVTRFIEKHPGEGKMILKKAGVDCTSDYDFHSKKQKEFWENYLIGQIENESCCLIS